ncbi:CheR family methyltransferase [Haliscomenobacter hydrossis]|uniref:Signal transduction histidine kinase with CheB and CheR activity n=1 Tax=Haliscomenobacter hydrossis (strain ATCC 27775 / DSM 1100 / LMG 10767 / O) TaxID=760192 RepID=F4L2E6_HALH1|nr:CheR family methyltransferase [Haliscomenobacter hydrossis]AEE52899.1 signal transduction histidine kinase with CheB and CheR activity [Haliscomenobacter hydrossis DSM 1100]
MKSNPLPDKKKARSKKGTSAPANPSANEGPKLKTRNKKVQDKPALPPAEPEGPHPFPVVAIGASAGGLEAITQLLQNLSPNTGMAFIYVQHLSPDHKSMLSPILSKATAMPVQDIEDMDKMQADQVYVMPYNRDIEVVDGHIKLIPRPQNKTSNLSIDVLFSSLAETHKENVIGIVLSGSASDGTRGLKEIKLAGGITFAQDDSAKFSSMPQSAIAEGVVDFIFSPQKIAQELNWMSKHPLVKRTGVKPAPEDAIANSNPNLKNILQLIHKKNGVDFSHYKMSTIKRRMLRRMVIHKMDTLKHYNELLAQKPAEVDLLYQDLLINVTDFFRDAEVFKVLASSVLSSLLKSKKSGETLRIWVVACATGEEVYSIAMILFELQNQQNHHIPFQIFASDLSAQAISTARVGEYSAHELIHVSPQRMQQFFTKSRDKYRINKTLRDVCVFAEHNILSDPPFSRMDFISCRNLLIYLDTTAQKKIISTLHYALNEDGCLMLGKSETIGASTQLFTALNKKYKIYSRKKNSGTYRIPEISPRILQPSSLDKDRSVTTMPKKIPSTPKADLSSAFDAVLLGQYVPASVIINHDLDILQFRGSTTLYLQHGPGKASFNILKMSHLEITFELRNAIHEAIKTKQPVRKTGIEMNRDVVGNTVQIVNIEVSPLKVEGEEPLLLVVFTGQQIDIADSPMESGEKNSIAKDRRIKKLEEELAAARAYMNSITQDHEAANEELQSANEEIISSNEELQSLNEELETSKEEIESTNEELTTSNHELNARIQQIEELYTYYETILATVHEPMLVLDKNIRIRSANESFCATFKVAEEDIIGTSMFKLSNNQWNIPALRELLEDIVPKNNRFHNFEVDLDFSIVGPKTLLLNAHRIVQKSKNEELIVLTMVDITDARKLALELQKKEKQVLDELMEAKRIAEQKTKIAEEAVKAKQQFLSNMSHEIRTPMNAIIGFTNVVMKTKLNEAQKEYINAIKVSGESLIILINDILDLAKVEAGKMVFEHSPFRLFSSVSDMLHLFETKMQEKNLVLIKQYDTNVPEILVGDPVRLRQIMLNLISNAVKFTNAGKITVRVDLLKEDQDHVSVEFSVSDTGIGIPENNLKQIFDAFEQIAPETTRLNGGTGLGLAIVKQMVKLQGGNVKVKSKVDKGSTFSFSLSFKKVKSLVAIENNHKVDFDRKDFLEKAAITNVKILVVEDVEMNQLLMKTLLSDFGFTFDLANNGKMAIEKLQKNKYDIILMDLKMPEMSGFEATAYIRNEMNIQTPIIALTADVTTVDFEKCQAAGMNDYISKPFDEQILYSKIVQHVKRINN